MWYSISMDKGSKIVFIILTIFITISVILTLNRAFITRDYEILLENEEAALDLVPVKNYPSSDS